MPALTSDNQIGILIKSDADLKAFDETNKSLGKLDDGTGKASKGAMALGAAGRVAAVGIAAAGAAVGAAGVLAIKSAGEYEQSRIAFETMLGSADKARKLMGEIAQFAKTTPFELPEVVAGTKQLLAFGFAQQDLLPTMRKLGDLASGLGVPVGQLTNVFGQVKVAGRLMGQDLLQFTNAGVPMIEALATTMKKPQSEIKKLVEEGKVGFPEVEAALNSLTGEGSKFGGMMDKQSKSFNGVVSNIKDGFGQILRNAVGITVAGDIIEGGLFDKVKNAANAALPYVSRLAEGVGPAIGKMMSALGMGVTAIKGFIQTLQDPDITSDGWFGKMEGIASGIRRIWDAVWNFLKPSVSALVNAFKADLLPALQRLWAIIQPQILPALKLLGMVLGGALVGGLWAAINVLRIIIQVVGWFINVLIEVGQRVVWVVNFIVSYLTFLWNFWSTVFNAIYEVVKTIFQAIYLAIAVAVSMIRIVVDPIVHWLSRPFQVARDWIVNTWNSLTGWFGGVAGRIGGALAGVYNSITAPFSRAWDWISQLPGRIAGAIGNVGQLLRDKIGNWDIPGPLGRVRDVIPGFATGGFTGTGGMNEVAGIVHKGEYVIPKSGVDQSTGLPKISTTNNRNVSINTVVLGSADAAREFFGHLDSDMLLTSKGLTPNRGAA